MASHNIALGSGENLAQLFSYPNIPDASETLDATILHWVRQTLANDGLQGAVASVQISATNNYTLVLQGPDPLAPAFSVYGARLPQFLSNGWDALTTVVPKIKADGKWDPSPDSEPPPYRPWRFFLPFGMAMANQKSLQFFHYPPIRLLEGTRDYLNDPVPVRVFELLEANGVATSDVALYNTVVDGCPIAAADDQGSKPGGDPEFGFMPLQYFGAYQRAQVATLLNDAPGHPGFTVPIVVYGAHPRDVFQKLYNVNLGKGGNISFAPNASWAEIVPGKKTPVVGANHPYNFYAEAQSFPKVGSGNILTLERCQNATIILRGDLAITRWQKLMADDPSQTPQDVMNACTAFWNEPAKAAHVCALVQHQASLFYYDPATGKYDPASLTFKFNRSLADAATFCSANASNPCAGITT